MKNTYLTTTALAIALAGSVHAVTLNTGDVDVGLAYEGGAWDLHVHDEVPDVEYEPDEAILQAGASSMQIVPNDPNYAFLGSPGSPVWILPQTEDPNLLYLGIATEEIDSGVFVGDTITLSLSNVTGPGNFSLYQEAGFGVVNVFMNSGDGITSADSLARSTGGHEHFNWAFTAPGIYTVDLIASGTLEGSGLFTSSGPVSYTFEVVPEPGTVGLLIVAALVAVWRFRNRGAVRVE